MPFALVVIGLLMIVTGARNTQDDFANELRADFTGPPQGNFIWWLAAIGSVGAVGYYKPLAPLSNAFLVLIIIVMILAQSKNGGGGFFGQLQTALASGPVAPTKSDAPGIASASNPATASNSGVTSNVGAFGQQPSDASQAKANKYINYIISSFFGV